MGGEGYPAWWYSNEIASPSPRARNDGPFLPVIRRLHQELGIPVESLIQPYSTEDRNGT